MPEVLQPACNMATPASREPGPNRNKHGSEDHTCKDNGDVFEYEVLYEGYGEAKGDTAWFTPRQLLKGPDDERRRRLVYGGAFL